MQSTSLTISHILITFFSYICLGMTYTISRLYNTDLTIFINFLLTGVGLFNIIFNWDLFALHYNRMKKNLADCTFFVFISIIIIGLLFFMNHTLIHAFVLKPSQEIIQNFKFLYIIFIVNYSFIFSFISLITFKCVIDPLTKMPVITRFMLSGLLFSLIFCISFVGFSPTQFLLSFVFYSFLYAYFSYTYHQTRSVFPVMIAYAVVLFIILWL